MIAVAADAEAGTPQTITVTGTPETGEATSVKLTVDVGEATDNAAVPAVGDVLRSSMLTSGDGTDVASLMVGHRCVEIRE